MGKKKFLVVLLSATLVHGAADPGYHSGHIEYQHHEGPHCHDNKEQKCHKVPKQDEHEECYVEYDIIDVVHHDDHSTSYHKRAAQPGGHHSCHDKKEQECHKHPDATTRKIPRTICKKIVDTIYIEECEEIINTQCDESHHQYHSSTHLAGHDTKSVGHSDHSYSGQVHHSYGGHH